MTNYSNKASGITLIEMIVGILISSLLIGLAMNFLRFGISNSNKGINKLHDIGVLSILMSQIECDLLRATKIIYPKVGQSVNSTKIEFFSDSHGNKGLITYTVSPTGIAREVKTPTKSQRYIFCKGQNVDLSFEKLNLKKVVSALDRTVMFVVLTVSSKDGYVKDKGFRIMRMITCRNISDDNSFTF